LKSKSSKKSTILLQIVAWTAAVLAVCICGLIAIWFYEIKPMTSKENEYTAKIKVPAGMSVHDVSNELESAKVIRSSLAFYTAARFRLFNHSKPFTLRSGVYEIKSSMSLSEVYDLIQSGAQEYITVQIPEGLTLSKIATLLEEDGVCRKSEFLEACRSKALLAEYNIPAENFEGYLFPDTYFLTPDMSPTDVVRKLADTFKMRIQTIESLKNVSPQKLHDVVILASIVEREYRVDSEAPLIASVFTNRIKQNIGLYSCATIEYIITEIEGKPHPERITYDDLKINSRYNTYKWAGLTPGPISNPGLVALNAAANPPKTNYFYFVLTNKEKGTHTFSTNFDTHIAAENGYYTKQVAGKK
jgi:UPF0755 protein